MKLIRRFVLFLLAPACLLVHERSAETQSPASGKRYAVLVGVENYDHPRLKEPVPLKYAVDDVTALGETLAKLGYEVTLLTDGTGARDPKLAPTKANVDAQIRRVLKQCRPEDTVILGFAGHGLQFSGQPDAYFCPSDARPFSTQIDSLVSITGIYHELAVSFAGVKVILVDACRNDPDPGRGRGLDADSAPPPPKGVAALFSCSAGQRAFEHDELKHGVFFHHVLEAFAGEGTTQAGDVTFYSLANYLGESVPVTMTRLFPGREQFPNFKSDLVGRPPVLARVGVSPLPALPAQVLTDSLGMQLKLIPAGEFLMGSPASEAGRSAHEEQHAVTISRPFYMGIHEVTRGQFAEFVRATEYSTEPERDGVGGMGWDASTGRIDGPKPVYTWRSVGAPYGDSHPVVNVTWSDIAAFCEWLSQREEASYRLPTEAEWEYACRAGTITAYFHGDDPEGLPAVGNIGDSAARLAIPELSHTINGRDGYAFTAPVGTFRANAFGLYDIHGNAWERCADWFADDAAEAARDPAGPDSGTERVTRGGGWNSTAIGARSAFRGRDEPSVRGNSLGFRVVRNLRF